jgi:nucleoside phosphorylase
MEAGGAAAAAFQAASRPGFFMVRAVSDLADADKDNPKVLRWRNYACDMAAAFAAALIRSLPVPKDTI